MSGWGSRLFGGSGRWSPFGRSSSSDQVTEADYSYITNADIARGNQTGTANRPPRDFDIVTFRHNKTSYPVQFPGYSIDNGTLTVGAARQKAASELAIKDAGRLRMFYKGKILKDDNKAFRDEGFRSGTDPDILVVVGDAPLQKPSAALENDEDESEDEFADATETDGTPRGGKKKKRNRRGKKKTKKASEPTSGTSTPVSAPPTPLTPLMKLEELASKFHVMFVPECVKFQASPPEDPAKREFEHKRLTETLLQQILMKLDGVEVEGDQEARARRKELVREVQGMLNTLDAVVEAK